ncbi:MAG: hypothetical protein V1916_01175 [Patescibacteria group bacterium]
MNKQVQIDLVTRPVGDLTQHAVSVNGRTPIESSWFGSDGEVTIDNITQSGDGVRYQLKFFRDGDLQTVTNKFLPWQEV